MADLFQTKRIYDGIAIWISWQIICYWICYFLNTLNFRLGANKIFFCKYEFPMILFVCFSIYYEKHSEICCWKNMVRINKINKKSFLNKKICTLCAYKGIQYFLNIYICIVYYAWCGLQCPMSSFHMLPLINVRKDEDKHTPKCYGNGMHPIAIENWNKE